MDLNKLCVRVCVCVCVQARAAGGQGGLQLVGGSGSSGPPGEDPGDTSRQTLQDHRYTCLSEPLPVCLNHYLSVGLNHYLSV